MEQSEGASSSEIPRPWQSYHTVYTNAKAGMDGVDKEKVQRIVYEMSKGSKYFENEERKEAFIRQKIEHMRGRCVKLTAADISNYRKIADMRVLELEATRDLSRIWLHVDMDAFYAAVETLIDPSLKGKPMAVGSMSMICTASYEARRFGVRAAMPGFIARKLCPELIFVPTDFKKYTYYSDLTRKSKISLLSIKIFGMLHQVIAFISVKLGHVSVLVFRKYDPNFMAASLDEAYLDITEVCRERGISGVEIAEELRTSVYEETGLTCSAGVAPNRLLAKVCSDINKPNGQFVLPNDRMAVITFISSLPIRKIGGIGKVTEHILKDVFGINTCEEMLQKGSLLCALFSNSTADFFLSVGLGLGGTDTPRARFRKSISSERTFSATEDRALLYRKLAEISETLSADMQKEGLHGRTLTLKLKTSSFEVRTRAVTLQKYISSSEDILKHASVLLKAELPVSLRLIGLRVSQFNEGKVGTPSDPTQKTLTNFITSRDAFKKNADDQNYLSSDINDHHFMGDKETGVLPCVSETNHCEFREPFDDNCLPDLDDDDHSFNNSIGQVEKIHKSQLLEVDSLVLQQQEGSYCDRAEVTDKAVTPDNEVGTSSSQEDQFTWVDDYKCSLCGTELPPSFIEERQEHTDFHLAERLQKEESGSSDFRILTPRQRRVQNQKDNTPSSSKRKKQKLFQKECTQIPIDMFFAKSNRNF